MITCQTCGTPLPDSRAECGHCQMLFFEETAEAAFLSDDDDEVVDVDEQPAKPALGRKSPYKFAEPIDEFDDDEDFAEPDGAESETPEIVQPIEVPVMQPVEPQVLEPVAQTSSAVQDVAAFLDRGPAVAESDLPVVRPTLQQGIQMGLTTRLEVHSAPGEGSPVVHALLDIDPVGAPLVQELDGPVAHVVLALDVSASMNSPDKYPVLTRALENMLNDLRFDGQGDVLVSLIVFAYGAEVLLRAEPASELTAREVLRLIDGSPLRFGRYTDLNGALSRAGRIAYDSHRITPRLPVRIYVLTDGKPQDMDAARETMQLIQKLPVDVNGLAFGKDADVDSLQQLIAGGRGGTVKHVRPETLSSAFERIAEVARHVVAKRALLDVELRPGVVGGAAWRFRPGRFAYGEDAFEAGTHFSTDLGTLETGRRYSLLFQLRLPPTEAAESEVARITLRVPGEGGPVTFETLVSIPRHRGAEMPQPEGAVVEARHILEAVGASDPQAQLKALRARHRLYVDERRDPYVIELIERAIDELERAGSLDGLSKSEKAVLQSHTQSVVADGPQVATFA